MFKIQNALNAFGILVIRILKLFRDSDLEIRIYILRRILCVERGQTSQVLGNRLHVFVSPSRAVEHDDLIGTHRLR